MEGVNAPSQRKTRRSSSRAANNARRATLLAQEGQFGQAAKALLSQGLDFYSQEAIDSMRAKHPPSPPPPPLPPPNASPYSFTATETLAALNSFHSLSAGGASGCRAAHIRESITSERGNALLSTMTRLINYLAAGKSPPEITPYLYSLPTSIRCHQERRRSQTNSSRRNHSPMDSEMRGEESRCRSGGTSIA